MSVQAALNELKRGLEPIRSTIGERFHRLIRREFWEHDDFDAFLAEGADELEYVRARTRMEAFIAEQKVVGDALMMVAVFAAMTLALICGWFGSRTLAVALFFGCLVLSIGLFLFEIYSPGPDSGCPGSRPKSTARRRCAHDR